MPGLGKTIPAHFQWFAWFDAPCKDYKSQDLVAYLEYYHSMSSTSKKYLSFRSYLEAELVSRCKKNPHYSLRSFAHFLEIDHSTLSQFIRGKRKISSQMQERLAEKLGLGPEQLSQFDPAKNYSQLTLDLFEITSEWYYFAIMELLMVKGFKSNPKWISKALGLEESEVETALLRLARIGFIAIDQEGNYLDISAKNVSTLDFNLTTPAHIKMQTQLLNKASEAMSIFHLEKRSQTGMTMAIDTSKIPQAKEMIVKFQRELSAFLEDGEQSDVYHLGISLFPLTSGELL